MYKLLILLPLLFSCVKVPDLPICRDLPEKRLSSRDAFGIEDITIQGNPVCLKEIGELRCGYCVWTISPKSKYIGEAEEHRLGKLRWSEIRPTAVLLPADSYAKLKEYVINSCKKSGDCQKDIDKWRVKLGGLEIR